MWTTPLPTSMASGTVHRRVTGRLVVISAALMLVAALAPVTATQAAGHRELPMLEIVGPDPFDSDPLQLETIPLGIGTRDDEAFVFTPPPGWTAPSGSSGDVGALFIDACDSTGSSWLVGANSGLETLDIILTDPSTEYPVPFRLLSLSSSDDAAPPALFAQDPIPCDQLHPLRTERLPDLTGTATYEGVGRRCAGFNADFVFRESKPGRGYDRYVPRAGQQNRVISTNPAITVDDSDAYDELHVFMAPRGPGASFEGIVIGGGPDTLPKRADVLRRVELLLGQVDAEDEGPFLDALARVRRSKPPRSLLKQLNVRGKPCTYHIELDFDDQLDDLALAELLDLFGTQVPVSSDDRFRVEIEWSDGSGGDIPRATLLADPGDPAVADAGFRPLAVFTAPDIAVDVLDGCDLNDRFWVFAAAATDAEYTLTVTDTQSGELATYDSLADPSPAISDTSAFATCP